MRPQLAALSLTALLTCLPASVADVKPHALFTDGMVLQQGVDAPVWGTAEPGEAIVVQLSSTEGATSKATADARGNWSVKLPPQKVGGPFTLSIRGKNSVSVENVLVGEVWVCSGQSNMEWSLKATEGAEAAIQGAKHAQIRLFTVPKAPSGQPEQAVNTRWVECSPQSVANFSAVAYHFGRALHEARKVPVGLIHTSWGGTPAQAWTSREALAANDQLSHYVASLDKSTGTYRAAAAKYLDSLRKYTASAPAQLEATGELPPPPTLPVSPTRSPNSTTLYNGMIAPLLPYAIKGAIWYQGESNAGRAYEYRTLFPAMIADWRSRWGQGDFPFLCVQLAPFTKIVNAPTESNWAELREAQLLTALKLKNVGMAVITDVGEEFDIHPRKKAQVGERLALAARGIAYGEKIDWSGPVYKSMRVDGNKAILSFDHVGGGLVAKGNGLTGFTITGEDRKWVNAEAAIQGDEVIVSSGEVAKPVAVRFGWANFPVVNLWNKAGLPASPFRTDDFPITTGPK